MVDLLSELMAVSILFYAPQLNQLRIVLDVFKTIYLAPKHCLTMQSPKDFQQSAITSTTNAPPVPSNDQNSNLSYATNGGQLLLASQVNPSQHSQHLAQMYSMNAAPAATDVCNAAFVGFRRLLAELSKAISN